MNWHWIAVSAILLTSPIAGFCQQIDWQTDLDNAKTMAAAENKLVLMHFSADWCRPCKHLETFVLTSPKVINAIDERVVAVRIDTDLHPELVKQYNITEIPTDVVITPAGRIVQKRQSPKDTSNFVHMLTSLDSVGKALSEDKAALVQKIDNILDTGKSKELSARESNDFIAKRESIQHPGPAYDSRQLKENMSSHAKLVEHVTFKESSEFESDFGTAETSVKAREPERVINDRFFNEKSNAVDVRPVISNTAAADSARPRATTLQPMTADSPVTVRVASDFGSSANMFRPVEASKPAQDNPETTARILTVGMDCSSKCASVDLQVFKTESTAGCPDATGCLDTVCAESSCEQSERANQAGALETSSPDGPDFGLDGKCPVTLITAGKWADGDTRFGCVHRGKTYLFADQAKLEQFQRDPESFSPLLAGFDPVVFHEQGELVEGLEKHGVFMGKNSNQRIVLFHSLQTRTKFQQNPRQYMTTIREAIEATDTLPR